MTMYDDDGTLINWGGPDLRQALERIDGAETRRLNDREQRRSQVNTEVDIQHRRQGMRG